jgi:methylenetetrahydrofolate dehydrogenase (NADP+)/methenyltetrahydrofolate cyclohydrolase
MQIIDGKKIRDEILAKVKEEVATLSFSPVFCDVLIGEDPVSAQYVRMKARMEDLIKEIKILNKMENMCGIIIQLPLPASLDQRKVLNAIDSRLDVDCLGSVASLKFYNGDFTITFPTALACMHLLDSLNLDLKDKKIIIIGKGELVGRPVKKLLNARNLETFVIDRKTEEAEKIKKLKEADVIISATGKGKLINGKMIKEGVVLIDAGTSELGAGIVGDIDLDSVSEMAGYVSPVPGGVGPVTVAMLLNNVLIVAKEKNSPHP